jgi:DNA-binding transcriptional LysR family regulator
MDLHHIRIFACVATHLSESRAAQELHLSQPVISQHLKTLQEQYGALFKRNGRGIELTEHGEGFCRKIAVLLTHIESVEKEYGSKADSEKFTPLSIGGSYGPSIAVLPSVVTLFKRHHPRVAVDFRVRNSPAMQNLVMASKVELAVITNPAPSPAITMEPFRPFQLCFFVAADHPLAKAKQVSAEALTRYPLVTGRTKIARSRTETVLGDLAARGLRLNVLLRCEWPDTLREVVEQAEAVGIHYEDVVAQGVGSGRFKIIKVAGVNLSVMSYILHCKEKPLSRNAQEFLQWLRRGVTSLMTEAICRQTHRGILPCWHCGRV